MFQVISEYTEQVKEKLLDQMLKQRTLVSEHCKEIKNKKTEIEIIIGGADEVEIRLMTIIKNDQAYLQKQMEEYYR